MKKTKQIRKGSIVNIKGQGNMKFKVHAIYDFDKLSNYYGEQYAHLDHIPELTTHFRIAHLDELKLVKP